MGRRRAREEQKKSEARKRGEVIIRDVDAEEQQRLMEKDALRRYRELPWGSSEVLGGWRGHPDLSVLRRSIYCITKLDAGLNECDVRLRLLCEVELVLEPVLRAREIAELVQLDTYRPPEPEEEEVEEDPMLADVDNAPRKTLQLPDIHSPHGNASSAPK